MTLEEASHLEELVQERQFAGILQTHAEVFFRLSNTLLAAPRRAWNKKHYFQLISESDALESFLDDYGARFNRTYAYLTELVASSRGFGLAGYSLAHLSGRFDSYGVDEGLEAAERSQARDAVKRAAEFIRESIEKTLRATREVAQRLGVELTPEAFPESNFMPVASRRRLPRNVDEAELTDERQKIAEVAAKFLQACEMLAEVGVRTIEDPQERRAFFGRSCTEEQARVYEATVHNLQSTYDTHIQNTVLEARDRRLRRLRGHASASLHLLEAVTHLVHFIERHEDEIRSAEVQRRIAELVPRQGVQDIALNALLYWANRVLQAGCRLAEGILPEYTNLQVLEVRLEDGLTLHARPAALIVGVVNHHGTPVEMEVDGKRCNAGSILSLLVGIGSSPGVRRLLFRGDERPLNDLRLLFAARLGEDGFDALPPELAYLKAQ